MKVEPSEDYATLRKQFLAMRTLCTSLEQQVTLWKRTSSDMTLELLKNNKSFLEDERKANEELTNLLEEAEAKIEELEAKLKQRS